MLEAEKYMLNFNLVLRFFGFSFRFSILLLMPSSLVFCTVFVLSVIVSFTAGDFAQSSNDDLFSVSDPLPTLDSSSRSSDRGLFPVNAPDSSLWDPANDDLGLDEPFQLAACSASSDLTLVGKKSRLRRGQKPQSCPNSASGVGNPADEPGDSTDADDFAQLINNLLDPESIEMLLRAAAKPNEENLYCYLRTKGEYPIGVCSSADAGDVTSYSTIPATPYNDAVATLTVSHCTLGMCTIKRATIGLMLT